MTSSTRIQTLVRMKRIYTLQSAPECRVAKVLMRQPPPRKKMTLRDQHISYTRRGAINITYYGRTGGSICSSLISLSLIFELNADILSCNMASSFSISSRRCGMYVFFCSACCAVQRRRRTRRKKRGKIKRICSRCQNSFDCK